MLERISVRDFAVAREVSIALGPGLTVFTGETGAGKSLVVDALAFAFGARRGREVIATGADRAAVTVTWDDGTHTVERTVARTGRASARLDGANATGEELAALGAELVDIHGQSEQTAILKPSEQLSVLDQYAALRTQRADVAGLVRELRATLRQRRSLAADQRERERLLDQLRFETEEIAAAGLQAGEDDHARAAAGRLANATRLQEAVALALEGLSSGTVGTITAAATDITSRDNSATALQQAALAFESGAEDLARALRLYEDGLEQDPARLAEMQERLDLIARLKRKYGDSIEDVLAYLAAAEARLAALAGAEMSVAGLTAKAEAIVAKLAPIASGLSAARREAAARLVHEVAQELATLGMTRSSLAIGFACQDDDEGVQAALPDFELVDAQWTPPYDRPDMHARAISESGFDRVEFQASFNAGESARALASVASGGETSRFLLALSAVLSASSAPRTIVFDEVDEGVGGRAGSLVGASLARLAERHQVLCITHLPQVAAFAKSHFIVTKQTDGERTWSEVQAVSGEERLAELAAMLGGVTPATLATAQELLSGVSAVR